MLIKFFGIVITLAFACVSQAQTGNLVRNGNFERTMGKTIPDWTTKCASPIRITSSEARFDKTSLEIEDTLSEKSCSAYSRPFSVTPGKSYFVEGWVKSRDLNGVASNPLFYLKFYDAAGVVVGSKSGTVAGKDGEWLQFSKTIAAPTHAVTASLLLYSSISAAQRLLFDSVSVSEVRITPPNEVNRFVSKTSLGRGDGTSAENAAHFRSASFWKTIQAQLGRTPVRVVFRAGKYEINSSAETLVLSGLGHATNRLTLTGEDMSSTRFVSGAAAATNLSNLIRLSGCQNMEISNIHFRTEAKVEVGYIFLITGASKNISLANLTSVNTRNISYAVLGFHKGTNQVSLTGSEFLRVGYDGHQHFIYNFRDVSQINIVNSVFEDSTGAYLRCRDVCEGFNIMNSEFKGTGSWGNKDVHRYAHFIELAVFNDVPYRTSADTAQQEWFGSGFSAVGNHFEYGSSSSRRAMPFSIHHSGYNPWDGKKFRKHLVSSTEAYVLQSGSLSAKRALILSKFGLDMYKDFRIEGNTYKSIQYLFELESLAAYGADNYEVKEPVVSGSFDLSHFFKP